MSILFPTFTDKEIPKPEKFNAFVQALEAKFTAGFGSAEIQWPLIAAGDIIMGPYDIQGGRTVFKVVNAAEYSTFEDALLAGAGGVVFIPPDTSFEISGESLRGTTAAIIGAGPSSVLRVVSSPSASYMLRNDQMGATTQFLLANLTLDGRSSAGGAGLVLRNVGAAILHNVRFQDFDEAALRLTNNGTSGQSSRRVLVSQCTFVGGSGSHIEGLDCYDVVITGCTFHTASDHAIDIAPSDGAAYGYNITISSNTFDGATNGAISVVGGSDTLGIRFGFVAVTGNTIYTSGGPAVRLGTTSLRLQRVTLADNTILSTGAGVNIRAFIGTVSGNTISFGANYGLDLETSSHITVTGNTFDGTSYTGIDAADAANCVISGNDLVRTTTKILHGAGCDATNNRGVPAGYANYTSFSVGSSSSGNGLLVTVPANRLRVGSRLRLRANFSGAGATTNSQCTIKQGALGSGNAVGVGYARGDGAASSIDVAMVITAATTATAFCTGWQARGDAEATAQTFSVSVNTATAMPFHVQVDTESGVTVTAAGLIVTLEEDVEIV